MSKHQSKMQSTDGPDWKKIVNDSLIELGLDRKELDLYTASMNLGPSTIGKLADHLSLSKPSVYKLIDRLSARGLASSPSRSGKQSTFTVEPATEILRLLKRKKDRCEYLGSSLTAAVPDIVAAQNHFVRQANVQMYRGRVQLNALHHSVLDDPAGNLRFFGSPILFRSLFTKEDNEAWTLEKVRRGIWNKVLIPSADELGLTPNPEAPLREIRIFKEVSTYPTIFQLFSSKVIFWWPETNAAMVVDNPGLFKMMESIFTTYWESATPLQNHRDANGAPASASRLHNTPDQI